MKRVKLITSIAILSTVLVTSSSNASQVHQVVKKIQNALMLPIVSSFMNAECDFKQNQSGESLKISEDCIEDVIQIRSDLTDLASTETQNASRSVDLNARKYEKVVYGQ